MAPKKLTPRQAEALRNLKAGRHSSSGLRGMAEFGGHERVLWSLRRRGLIDDKNQITQAGSEAV